MKAPIKTMSFAQLADFVQRRMRMSHIYQPLLIKALAESDGMATVRQLVFEFLAEDESDRLTPFRAHVII